MIQAVIFDWAGTTVDYGCFAPVQAFQQAFAHFQVPVTLEETRKPMGLLKRDHIRTMLQMERIGSAWQQVHGRPAEEGDVEAVYRQFEPKLFAILQDYASPKPQVLETVAALRQMGLSVLLLTGDHRRTAEAIAKEVGIPRVIPEVLPQQKEAVIRSLQQKGEVVAMVGDGINDAPALVRADIGIAIGAGTDIAIDSADIVLMHSDPADIPAALQLSRSVLRNIKQNLFKTC